MMPSLAATVIATEKLPLIDISGLKSSKLNERERAGTQLREACADKGFFYIKGHDIPSDLIVAIFREAQRFFDLPDEIKVGLHKKRSNANRGYEPLGGQRLEDGAPPDLKESFFIGVEHNADDPGVLAGQFGRGPNQWPPLPGFREVVDAYTSKLTDLGRLLYRGLALSLGVDKFIF